MSEDSQILEKEQREAEEIARQIAESYKAFVVSPAGRDMIDYLDDQHALLIGDGADAGNPHEALKGLHKGYAYGEIRAYIDSQIE